LAGLLGRRRRSSTARSSPLTVLRLERLEDRCVPAVHHVTSSADTGNLGTLRYEVAHAQANDYILIDVSKIVLTQGELYVNAKNLIISPYFTQQSPNARVAISGNNSSRVFEFAADATIKNLDITDGNGLAGNAFGMGYRDGEGGAILNYAKLLIDTCTFTHNSATFGGAIFNLGFPGSLDIGNSMVTGNSAQQGGGICNYGAYALVWYCNLWGNSASQDGGAISNRGAGTLTDREPAGAPSGTLEVVGGTFYSNVAGHDGGAIDSWVSNLKVTKGDFEHNKAQNGGAIINVSGTAVIDGTTLLSNLAQPTVPGNGVGGALENWAGGTFQVSNCLIQYNGAAEGGGIWNAGQMTVSNSTLDSNWATFFGDNVVTGATMTITGCHLIDPSSTSYSVFVYPQTTLHVGGSTFQGTWKIKGPWINDGNNQGV
jgi:hypothetical protein